MKKTYLVGLFLICLFFVNGQNTPNFQLSPNVSQINKLIDYPVNYNNGTTNISIPLYTINSGNISIPISIDYSSSGIKVNEESSNIGLGWSLTAGGVVSRQINGIIDDSQSDVGSKVCGGVMYAKVRLDSIVTVRDKDPLLFEAGYCIVDNNYDERLDNFSYSFPEGNGKFIFDQKSREFVESEKSLNIIKYFTDANGTIISWDITSPNGVKYKFGKNNYYNNYELNNTRTYPSFTPDNGRSTPIGVSAWYLNSVVDEKGNIVSFEYNSNPIEYVTPMSKKYTNGIEDSGNILFSINSVEEKTISKIIFKEGYIIFNYGNELRQDIKGSKRLSNIQIFDIHNKSIKQINFDNNDYFNADLSKEGYQFTPEHAPFLYKRLKLNKIFTSNLDEEYSFNYNNINLPQKYSYSQDYWGYYNNEDNESMVPKTYFIKPPSSGTNDIITFPNYNNRSVNETYMQANILESITSPIKGVTKFYFESNKQSDQRFLEPFGTGNNVLNQQNIKNSYTAYNYNFDTYNATDCKISSQVSHIVEYSCEFEIKGQLIDEINILDPDVNNINNFSQNSFFVKTCPSDSKSTPINVFPGFDERICNFFFQGIFDSNNKKIDFTKTPYSEIKPGKYFFKINFNGTPSIILNNEAYVNIYIHTKIDVNPYLKNVGGLRIKSIENYNSPSNSNYSLKKIFEYDFKISEKQYSSGIGFAPLFNALNCLDFDNTTNTNTLSKVGCFSFDNNVIPTPINITHYPKVKEIVINNEDNNKNYFKEYLYDTYFIGAINVPFNSENMLARRLNQVLFLDKANKINKINSYDEKNIKVKSSTHEYNVTNFNDIYMGYSKNNIGGKKIGEQHLVIHYSTPISYLTQKMETDSVKFNSTIMPIVNSTSYKYSVNNPLLVSKQTTTNPKGETLTTEYQYPPDLMSGYEQSAIMQEMVNRNMIATPVITKSKNDSTTLSEQRTLYQYFPGTSGNLILPEFVYAKKGENTTTADRKITYNSYDANGNLTQYTPENGIPIAIIWGYNGQYPVLKVEGATYSEVMAKFDSGALGAINNGSITSTSFDAYRPLFPNAMITSYIYQPLIGVTSITGPNGQTEYYNYDSANRLQSIVNEKKEVIKTFEYNYKQP